MSFDRGMFQCDECPDYLDTDEEDFRTALAVAKRKGWRTHQIKGEWLHSCPSCVRRFASRQ
jgi:hypothetical protein